MLPRKMTRCMLVLIVSQTSSFVISQRKGQGQLANKHNNNLLWSQAERTAQDTTFSSHAIHHNDTQIRRRSKVSKRRRSDKWEHMVAQLRRYYELHGHSLVTPEEHPELAQWCKTIRRNYRHQQVSGTAEPVIGSRPTLSDEKLKVLSQLKFVWNVQTFLWNQRFHDLCSFRAQHAHCHVPLKSDLGMWVHNQKCSYRALLQGKPSNMTPERLAALSSIGFWDDFQTNSDSWNQRYQELQEFHQVFGHSNVPEDFTENYQLGQWVMNQRLAYKKFVAGLPTPLTPERIASLEALQFRWNVHSYNWFAMCHRLEQYAHQHGHVQIATSDEANKDLRQWLIQQRHAYQRRLQGRPTSMTDRRQAALESIPYVEWNTKKSNGPKLEDWDELFAGIREKGIVPGMRPKQHWFEGENRFKEEVKDIYTDEDLLDLWNQEDDEE